MNKATDGAWILSKFCFFCPHCFGMSYVPYESCPNCGKDIMGVKELEGIGEDICTIVHQTEKFHY